MNTDNPKCETCRWWTKSERFESIGECRVRAPKPTPYSHIATGCAWPATGNMDFCGEHSSFDGVTVNMEVGSVAGWKTIPGSAGGMVKI